MTIFTIEQGTSPIILGFPHTGTFVPPDVRARLNARGRELTDTDWHIERLYGGLLPGATTVCALFHRYVIDANRDPEDRSLYPGQNTTGLVPKTDFDGRPIWREGAGPGPDDTAARVAAYHTPYHKALAQEICRIRDMHGVAILFDCHSIRSCIPFLFDGLLPDLNIGTDGGRTCDARIEAAVYEIARDSGFSSVLNGRFKGGWTTRHYGRPEEGVHAIQLEIAQSAYLSTEQVPFDYDEARADRLRRVLRQMLQRLENMAPGLVLG